MPVSTPSTHRFFAMRGRLRDASKLSQLDVQDVRQAEGEGQVVCPTCRGPVRVVIGPDGPVVMHTGENPYAGHEPEDLSVRQGKKLLSEHLQKRFPSGKVRLDVPVPEAGQLADMAFVNPRGGKMVVEYQAQDILGREVRDRAAAYEEQGVRCLWMLDSSRLKLTKSGSLIKKVTLERLETALMAMGEPLIYLDSKSKMVALVRPHKGAVELAKLGEPRIGQVPAIVRRYRLSGLRVREGNWWIDTSYDGQVTLTKPLPESLQKKLASRRATAGKV